MTLPFLSYGGSSIIKYIDFIRYNFKFYKKKLNPNMKKILISTGGTGGHVMPAIALYKHYKIILMLLYCTDKRGLKFINRKIIPVIL